MTPPASRFLLSCLRLAVDLARTEPELLLQIKRDGEHRDHLTHDERTELQAHTRGLRAKLRGM